MKVKRRLASIVLAAGRGSRFGGGKLMAPWGDGVLLDAALASAFAAPVERVLLVVGADRSRVAEAGRLWAERAGFADRLAMVESPGWAVGLSASLRAGFMALPIGLDGAYVFLGDMPRTPVSVLAPLADALARADAAVPICMGSMGHPALIGAAVFPAIQGVRGDRGARGLLEKLGHRLARVETHDLGVLFDVDTPAALGVASRDAQTTTGS